MPNKEPFTSALGTFWIHGAPDQRMAGRLTIDGFPRLTMFNVGSRQTVTTKPRQTILGVTEKGEYVSLFGTLGSRDQWIKNTVDDIGLRFRDVSFGTSVNFTANTMVIGEELHLDEHKVYKITFTSAVAEHFLHLNASDMLENLRFRKSRWDKNVTEPITTRKLRTVYVPEKKIKVRLFINALPNESSAPKARWQIDFLDGVTLDTAINAMQGLRDLLSVLCNEFVDIQNPMVLYRVGSKISRVRLIFYNFRSSYENRERLAVPMVSLARDQELFYKVIKAWICEPGRDKIARRAFIATLLDDGVLKLSDVREVVTLLEMKGREKFKPLEKADFNDLRSKLRSIVDEEIKKLPDGHDHAAGLESIRKRLDTLNSVDARPSVRQLIETLPPDHRSQIIPDPAVMATEIIDLRNDVTHDLSRLTNRSYQIANKVIHILRWLYAVLDAMALNVSIPEFEAYFLFHRRAMHIDETTWSRE